MSTASELWRHPKHAHTGIAALARVESRRVGRAPPRLPYGLAHQALAEVHLFPSERYGFSSATTLSESWPLASAGNSSGASVR